jgi:putative flippase GtrA
VGLSRFVRFNVVGVVGFILQLGVLALLTRWNSVSPLVATGVAVEAAILHNFCWHERWTWADRPVAGRARLARLARFHLTNGLVSIAGNLVIVAALSGLNVIVANAFAVVACSLVNFAAGDRLVFATRFRAARSSPTYL